MELMSLLTWWFGTLDICMGIKLTLTHLLYSASPGFCPVAANIPKKRLNTAGGEYCSSRLNVRFATVPHPTRHLNKSEHKEISDHAKDLTYVAAVHRRFY